MRWRRIRHRRGRLASVRVRADRCPQLLAEAGLYRWAGRGDGDAGGETPLDEHNHALAALRYLISRLDERRMARQDQGFETQAE